MTSLAATAAAISLLFSAASLAQRHSSTGDYSKLPPPCANDALSLGLDSENGAFDGMSHGGTLVVLRNTGPTACQIPRLPSITFLDVSGRDLNISTRIAPVRGMHPGPVMLPIALAPTAEATSTLRWVSSQVYDHGACVSPFQIEVIVGGAALRFPFNAVLCGPSAATIAVTPTWFQLDPTWKPIP